jgi:adenine-specific DNA-methyltransferase
LVQIPREALEVKDAREKVKFFDLNYLDVETKKAGKKVTVKLKDFAIANPEYLPKEVRKSVRKFADFIDYWAVDFDYKGDTFHNMDQSYKTRKDRTLAKSLSHTYEKAGKYNILVRVVDMFGNDTTKILKVTVR